MDEELNRILRLSQVEAEASAEQTSNTSALALEDCPKCGLNMGLPLFQFDCNSKHRCCNICAYDYVKISLTQDWILPSCPYTPSTCSGGPLSAVKVKQLVGSEASKKRFIYLCCCCHAIIDCGCLKI